MRLKVWTGRIWMQLFYINRCHILYQPMKWYLATSAFCGPKIHLQWYMQIHQVINTGGKISSQFTSVLVYITPSILKTKNNFKLSDSDFPYRVFAYSNWFFFFFLEFPKPSKLIWSLKAVPEYVPWNESLVSPFENVWANMTCPSYTSVTLDANTTAISLPHTATSRGLPSEVVNWCSRTRCGLEGSDKSIICINLVVSPNNYNGI